MATRAKKDWFFTILLGSSLLGFLLFAVLSFFASGYKSAALRAGIARCHLNIQSIEESYALADAKKKKEMLGANGELNIKAFDLPENLTICPMSGIYKIENIHGEEICICTFHGDRDGKIPGKIDPDHSIFYWIFAWIKEAAEY